MTLEDFGLSGFIHTDDGAIVIGEPHVAATWFPANDHPRDKATFTFHITVPAGVEALSNGKLVSQQTSGGKTTWNWNAVEPMATYLAFMAIGQFDVDAYSADGLKYWDAIDSSLLEDLAPPVAPPTGAQLLYSQISEPAYKRITRTIAVPAGGAQLSFDSLPRHRARLGLRVRRGTHRGRRRLDDVARRKRPHEPGHGRVPRTTTSTQPVLRALRDAVHRRSGRSGRSQGRLSSLRRRTERAATGTRSAAQSDGWEHWSVALPDAGGAPRQVEVSIAYASDGFVQGQGVAIDDVVVSTGAGSTGVRE